jgi:hypothetical protein
MNSLDIPKIFKNDAMDLIQSRNKAIEIHHTSDIKAAGNEVEQSVRDYFKRMLPSKYYVTHGHLIDRNGIVSPQIDLIISDNESLPSLMKTKDGTEYIPIESVYLIAEIKSTYYKAKNDIMEFSEKISYIENQMYHDLVENTAYNGRLDDETLMRDMYLCKGNKFLNKIFTFIIFIVDFVRNQ